MSFTKQEYLRLLKYCQLAEINAESYGDIDVSIKQKLSRALKQFKR